MLDRDRPVYTIGTAAEILGVHPRTLRLYEDGGLLRPARKNNRRFYSTHDLQWISTIRYLLHEQGLNQEGLRRLLARIPCWEINGCDGQPCSDCPAAVGWTMPCWELARQADDDRRRCFECQVYLTAASFVLDDRERQIAANYRAPE